MILRKEIRLSVFARRKIGNEGYKKLKFNCYYADDFIRPGTDIPDSWNMKIVKMNCCVPALVPEENIKDYVNAMVDLYGKEYFWGRTDPQVFEVNEYK